MKPTAHLSWILLLVMSVGLTLTATPIFHTRFESFAAQKKKDDDRIARFSQHITEMLDDQKTAAQLETKISPDAIKQTLSAVTQEFLVNAIVGLSETYRIDDLVYHLSEPIHLAETTKQDLPPALLDLSEAAQKSMQQQTIDIQGAAASDLDVIAYLNDLRAKAKGYVQIEKWTMEPTPPDRTEAVKGQKNLKFQISFKWIANIPPPPTDAKGDKN